MDRLASIGWRWRLALFIGFLAFNGVFLALCPCKSLDMFFTGFTPHVAVAHLNSLGSEGIARCRNALWPDLVYPLIYALLFSSVLAWLVLWVGTRRWLWLVALPWVGMALDYAENVCLGVVLYAWPRTGSTTETCLWLSGQYFTPYKWLMAFLSAIAIVVLFTAGCIVSYIRARRARKV